MHKIFNVGINIKWWFSRVYGCSRREYSKYGNKCFDFSKWNGKLILIIMIYYIV